MHGKWGMPQSPYLKPVVDKLSPDCRVVLLEMPWSRKRLYDKPYRDALQQIKAAVDSLRQSGTQWIAVGGQSFGANAALAYMAHVGDADAIIPLAPGHVPETFYQYSDISRVVDESSRLVQSGKGDTLLELNDMNQGRRQSLKLTAEALWSYFNPQGLGNMSLSAQHSKKAVPVFWAIGNLDPLYGSVSEEIYRRLPADPGSVYLEVRADHATTPEAAAEALGKWVAARKVR
jgi:dienelactone hydrolase